MKRYLFLFIGTLLLLFGTPKSSKLQVFAQMQQSSVTGSCSQGKVGIKKKCAKKCLRHQRHSDTPSSRSSLTDCGQHLYGLIAVQHLQSIYTFETATTNTPGYTFQYLAPDLSSDPDPPRFS